MLKVTFNPYKGYCIPKGSVGAYESGDSEEIHTDGFDRFDWSLGNDEEEDDDGASKKVKSFYDIYNKPESDDKSDNSMYDDESKVPMNHISEITKNVIEEDVRSSLRSKKGKPLSKKEAREFKKTIKKRNTKNSKRTQNEFDGHSDPKKVKILNGLYKEILSLYPKNLKNDTKLGQFFDISIYKEDLEDLKDDEWLCDNNISFVYEYLERYQLFQHDKLVSNAIQLVRPSMVYLLANFPTPADLKGVLPPMETAKFVFLPVNDNDDVESARAGSHWSLVVLSILDKTAFIFDSMDGANDVESKQVIKKVSEYLGMKFHTEVVSDTPQQINGSDCGIMVCQMTGALLSRLLDLEHLKENYVDFGVKNLRISAIDGRIFVMGTILNILRHKQLNND